MSLIETCRQAHEHVQRTGLIDRSLGILATTLHICLLASRLTRQDARHGREAPAGVRVRLMVIIALLALLTLLAVMDAVICTCL